MIWQFVIDYGYALLGYLIVGALFYIPIRWIYIKKHNRKLMPGREFLYFIFVEYLIAMLTQTILPIWRIYFINGSLQMDVFRNTPSFNFIPFKSISYFLFEAELKFNTCLNLLANIFLLFPFGLLYPLIDEKRKNKTIVFGVLFSAVIEIFQIIPGRSTDIDDVILNTLGCTLGFLCYIICRRVFLLKSKEFREAHHLQYWR